MPTTTTRPSNPSLILALVCGGQLHAEPRHRNLQTLITTGSGQPLDEPTGTDGERATANHE